MSNAEINEILENGRSNQAWQIDHTLVDIALVDECGQQVGRPWLTTRAIVISGVWRAIKRILLN